MLRITPPHFNILKQFLTVLLFFFFSAHAEPISNFKGSLSVNQGTLNYDVGIEVPLGVAGVVPKLLLSYSSNRGNGYIGQGWSLSGLSSITRCGSSFIDDGIDLSVEYSSRDNYCMDGKKLIPINGEKGAVGTEYRTQIESYTKIVSIGGSDGNPDKFKVWMASGKIYEYGLESTHIEKIGGINNTWLLSKISNRYNNGVLFDYYNFEDKQPVIKSIVYANGLNKILFNYSDREDVKSSYKIGVSKISSKKLESITTEVNGEEVTKYLLIYNSQSSSFDRLQLKSIKKCKGEECSNPLEFFWKDLNSDGSKKVDTLFAESYTFPNIASGSDVSMVDLNNDGLTDIYEVKGNVADTIWLNNGSGEFISTSTAQVKSAKKDLIFLDFNGDGFVDILEENSSIHFNNGSGSFVNSKPLEIEVDIARMHFIDIDQDGDKDIYQIGKNSDYIWENDGTGSFTKRVAVHQTNSNANLPVVTFSDVNDDGQLDIIRMVSFNSNSFSNVPGDSIMVYIKSANSEIYRGVGLKTFFGSSALTKNQTSAFRKTSQEYFIDFNNDGKIDILSIESSSSRKSKLYLSKKYTKISYYVGAIGESKALKEMFQEYELDIHISTGDVKFAHLNSDNYLDICQLDSEGKRVNNIWFGNGIGRFVKKTKNPNIKAAIDTITFVDVNGDGVKDIFNGEEISLNDGNGEFLTVYKLGFDAKDKRFSFADFNGDNLTDVVVLKRNAPMYTNQLKPAVIIEVKDAFDNVTAIEYKRLNDKDVYSKSDEIEDKIFNIQTSRSIVSSITSANGLGGTNKISYQYHGLKTDFFRGSLGFKTITTFNELTKIKNVVEYFQEFPLIGTVKSSHNSLEESTLSTSEILIDVIQKDKQYLFRVQKDLSSTYFNGQHIKDTIIEFKEYDEYGNPIKVVTTTKNEEESYSKSVTNEYSNSTEEWILGRLIKTTAEYGAYNQNKFIIRGSTFTYYPNGSLKSETIGSGLLQLIKSYEYDTFGNRIKDTISSSSLEKDRVTERTYDTTGRFLLRTKNPLGHTQAKDTIYDIKTGAILENTNVNGLTTQMEYNSWGQVKKQTKADGTITRYDYTFDDSRPLVKYKVTIKSSGSPEVTTYYDSFGRKLYTQTKRFDGKDIFVDTYYNKKGEVEKKSFSYTEDETPMYSLYKYDDFGKLIQTETPAPSGGISQLSIEYNGLRTTRIDAKGHKKIKILNILGKLKRVEEEGTSIDYLYDSIGNLIKTVPNEDEAYSITMRYDTLGRKIYMKDPDMGEWSYSYDALGNLISQTDAKGQITSFKYDILNRKIEKITVDGVSSWHYDTAEHGMGKIAIEQSDEGVRKQYTYDEYGRVSDVQTIIDNKQFDQSFSYKVDGKLDTATQPNGFKLIYGYNEQGYLESIKSPAQQIKDFDFDHFESLIEKTMATSLDHYKKYLELSDKINRLKSTASYYEKIANSYGEASDRYTNYANTLRSYAQQYKIYSDRYYNNFLRYKNLSNYYMDLAHRYSRYGWWGQYVAKFFYRISDRYAYYADRYAYYSRYYAEISQRYSSYADSYEKYASYMEDNEEYYRKEAEKLYAEANQLSIEAEKYKRMSEATSGPNQEVADEYQEILSDAEYVYHYKVMEQDSLGRVTKYISGNGLVTEDEFDETGVMLSSKTGYTFDEDVRELNYAYDDNFNLIYREDKKMELTQNYVYDDLDRISYSTLDGSKIYGSTTFSYEYDIHGNIVTKSGTDMEYYSGTHRVKQAGSKIYEYDETGNMLKNGDTTIEYNGINKPSFIKEEDTTISFKYDMNGRRYKREQDDKSTYYISKGYEYIEPEIGESSHKYLIYAYGKVVTIHTETKNEGLDFHETRYLHYDSLGSVDTITDQTGDVVQRMAYKPFGEQIDVKKPERTITNRGYTGHEHIKKTNFIHMNARIYDPTIGRFLSADTYIPAPDNAQSFNRYSYVLNNPLRYVDPSGHWGVKSIKRSISRGVKHYAGKAKDEFGRATSDIKSEVSRAVNRVRVVTDGIVQRGKNVVRAVLSIVDRAASNTSREINRAGRNTRAELTRNGQLRDIVGGVVMVVGAFVIVASDGSSEILGGIGVGIMACGADIINYNPNEPDSSSNEISCGAQIVNVSYGNEGLTPNQQATVDRGAEESVRINNAIGNSAGNTSGASTMSHPLGLTDSDMTGAYNNMVRDNELSSLTTIALAGIGRPLDVSDGVLVADASDTTSRIISGIGGSTQIYTGVVMQRLPGLQTFGQWMMTIGTNNLTYATTGFNPMQEGLGYVFDPTTASVMYSTIDLFSSGAGLITRTPTVMNTAFWGNRVIYQPAYRQLSAYGLLTEAIGAMNNISQIYGEINSDEEEDSE